MSCSCGVLKKNVNETGVFGVSSLALRKNKDKVLMETTVFGLSGVFYDWVVHGMIYDENGEMRSGMQNNLTPKMIKAIYQVLILGGLNFATVKKDEKLKLPELIKSVMSVWIANYGVDMLDKNF